MTKQALRKHHKELRMQLTLPQQHVAIAGVLQHLEQLPLPALQVVLSYKPLVQQHEFPAAFVEEWLLQRQPGLTIAYPRVLQEQSMLEAVMEGPASQWVTGAFGIEELEHADVLLPATIDLVLVPLLAFDTYGHRVGYGKGFYDRYLATCRPDTLSLGLSWFGPVDEIEDVHLHDIPLKYCATPSQLYAF
ncbi:MAG TPA: 5-formyltetrahydrofolate cyclo-ligase [Phnomibacter sp.]|nr:5-formyltetrahydrofolate cyclo-ligase [Phnomibacter sp.]